MRRGVPSAQAVWGNSVAILTGDLLFARASSIVAGLGERALTLQSDTFERLVPRPAARDHRAARRRGPDRALPAGARRQDRLAHRGRRPGRRASSRMRPTSTASRSYVRREGRRRVPADRRHHRPVARGRDRPARQAGTDLRSRRRRRCRCCTCARAAKTDAGCRRAARPPRARRAAEFSASGAEADSTAAIAELREHDVTPRDPRRGAPLGRGKPSRRSTPARGTGEEGADAVRADDRRARPTDSAPHRNGPS